MGFDFHCGRSVLGIVGKLVRGRYPHRCRGEIGWPSVTDRENGDRYSLVCSPLDDESERHEIVPIEGGVILITSFYLVFHIEGNQASGAELKESCAKPIGIGPDGNLTLISHRSWPPGDGLDHTKRLVLMHWYFVAE